MSEATNVTTGVPRDLYLYRCVAIRLFSLYEIIENAFLFQDMLCGW